MRYIKVQDVKPNLVLYWDKGGDWFIVTDVVVGTSKTAIQIQYPPARGTRIIEYLNGVEVLVRGDAPEPAAEATGNAANQAWHIKYTRSNGVVSAALVNSTTYKVAAHGAWHNTENGAKAALLARIASMLNNLT